MLNLRTPSYEELEALYYQIVEHQEFKDLMYDYNFSIEIDNQLNAFGVITLRSDTDLKHIRINIVDQSSFDNLIYSIAHEIAHGRVEDHNSEHERLSQILKRRIKVMLKNKSIRNRSEKRRVRQTVQQQQNQKDSSIDSIYATLINGRRA